MSALLLLIISYESIVIIFTSAFVLISVFIHSISRFYFTPDLVLVLARLWLKISIESSFVKYRENRFFCSSGNDRATLPAKGAYWQTAVGVLALARHKEAIRRRCRRRRRRSGRRVRGA